MNNPGLPQELWNELDQGVWHATSQAVLQKIISSNAIKPSIDGGYSNSFCRSLGAVSVFDFGATSIVGISLRIGVVGLAIDKTQG